MENVIRFFKFWLPPLLYMSFIVFLSSLSKPTGNLSLFKGADKIAHFFEYMILSILVTRAVNLTFSFKKKSYGILLVLSITLLFGISDEIHQYFVPNRSMELGDIISDLIGIIFGIFVYTLFTKEAKSSSPAL